MGKTLVCIDSANLHYYLNEKQWGISWEKFRNYIRGLYGETIFIFYDGIRCKAHFFAVEQYPTLMGFYISIKKKKSFFKYLRRLGYIVEWKFSSQTFDKNRKEFIHKCNFDVEITIGALSRINDYERFILCSGDRDFTALMKYLKGNHKKTVLIYPADRTSKEFTKTTTECSLSLGSIKEHIKA